jgi:hypothetical protein
MLNLNLMGNLHAILARTDIITNMAMVTNMVIVGVRLNPHEANGGN